MILSGSAISPTDLMTSAGMPATTTPGGTSLIDDRPGGNDAAAADCHPFEHDRVGPDQDVVADDRPACGWAARARRR